MSEKTVSGGLGEGLKGLVVVNYADGTHGSYCIARTRSEKYTEYWNPDGWKAFGCVFKDKQLADAVIAALEAAAPPSTALLKRKVGWMDSTDFDWELGHALRGNKVYPDEADLREHRKCIDNIEDEQPCQAKRVYAFDANDYDAALATPAPQAPASMGVYVALHFDQEQHGWPRVAGVYSTYEAAESRVEELGCGTTQSLPLDKPVRLVVPAATQEQPARSGAAVSKLREALKWALNYIADGSNPEHGKTPKHDCGFLSNPAGGACSFHERYFESWEALTGHEATRPAPGSPRKVGEEGARMLASEHLRPQNLRFRIARAMAPILPDEELRLEAANLAALSVNAALLEAARSSSAPVGEQKQEEGV